jgi:thiamine biosynthesis lipoprotein
MTWFGKQKHRWMPVLFLSLLLSCGGERPASLLEFQGPIMGTSFQIKVVPEKGRKVDTTALESALLARMQTVNALMSNWDPNSEISRFNRHRGAEPFAVNEHTAKVVARALDIAALSGGTFDPTISPLIELWGFGTSEERTVPDQAEIDAALALTGYQNLRVSDAGLLVKTVPGLTVNLSALAKGYAVDLVAEELQARGLTSFMVNIGGEIRVLGNNERGQAWRLAIEAPDPATLNEIYKVVTPGDRAMATSGDYRNYFTHEGTLYSHLLDPRSGWPIPARVTSATVLAPDCMTADALATALTVMAPEAGLQMIEGMENVACLLILRGENGGMEERQSSGMAAFIAND